MNQHLIFNNNNVPLHKLKIMMKINILRYEDSFKKFIKELKVVYPNIEVTKPTKCDVEDRINLVHPLCPEADEKLAIEFYNKVNNNIFLKLW